VRPYRIPDAEVRLLGCVVWLASAGLWAVVLGWLAREVCYLIGGR
jgi:hypothetical protein